MGSALSGEHGEGWIEQEHPSVRCLFAKDFGVGACRSVVTASDRSCQGWAESRHFWPAPHGVGGRVGRR